MFAGTAGLLALLNTSATPAKAYTLNFFPSPRGRYALPTTLNAVKSCVYFWLVVGNTRELLAVNFSVEVAYFASAASTPKFELGQFMQERVTSAHEGLGEIPAHSDQYVAQKSEEQILALPGQATESTEPA